MLTLVPLRLGRVPAPGKSLINSQVFLCLRQNKVSLTCSIFQFPWYKYSHPGQFQATNGLILASKIPKFSNQLSLAVFKLIYLTALGLICNMWGLVLRPGMEPSSLHWELRILATEPPGESPSFALE